MRRRERVEKIREVFNQVYGDADCSLDYKSAHELLVSVILAAQCTDARVNIVTPALFNRYKNVREFAEADIFELEGYIKSCGFYHAKAKNIISSAGKIVEKFGGKVPDNMDDLLNLDGVGRKTANLILGDVYGKGGMVIDTHAKRLLKRFGLTNETDPTKVEFDVEKHVPVDYQSQFCHQLVHHGRAVCTARNPKCNVCPIEHLCKKNM